MTYVAVIVRQDGDDSHRPDGTWTAFTARTQSEVVDKAMRFLRSIRGEERYEVQLGTLRNRVIVPITYELEKL